jgi:lipase ATG15
MLFAPLLPISLNLILTSYLAQHVSAQSLRFKLRHAHGLVPNSSQVVFSDYESISSSQFTGDNSDDFEIPSKSMIISRARSQSDFFAARSLGHAQYDLPWDDTEVIGPDVSKRETLLMLAKMTNNAYYIDRGRKGWYDLGSEWNTVRTSFLDLWIRLMAL